MTNGQSEKRLSFTLYYDYLNKVNSKSFFMLNLYYIYIYILSICRQYFIDI